MRHAGGNPKLPKNLALRMRRAQGPQRIAQAGSIHRPALHRPPTRFPPRRLGVVISVLVERVEADAAVARQVIEHPLALTHVDLERLRIALITRDVFEVIERLFAGVARFHVRVVRDPTDTARHRRRATEMLALLEHHHAQAEVVPRSAAAIPAAPLPTTIRSTS